MQSEHLCGFDSSLVPSWEVTVAWVTGINSSVVISQFPTFLLVEEVVAPWQVISAGHPVSAGWSIWASLVSSLLPIQPIHEHLIPHIKSLSPSTASSGLCFLP